MLEKKRWETLLLDSPESGQTEKEEEVEVRTGPLSTEEVGETRGGEREREN